MAAEDLDTLRKEFEAAKKDYEFWTRGGRCQAGSQTWEEMTARYNAARDAYALAQKHRENTGQSKQPESSGIDALLGIGDRGQFDKDLEHELRGASELHPLAMVMVDLDDFKAVNDTYGHPAGDNVLREVASIMGSVCERKGLVYRYGGEEIALILPNYALDEAASLAERIRREIAVSGFDKGPERITVSVGIACYPETTEIANQLVQDADDAMYKAKSAGKNQVCKAELMERVRKEKNRGARMGGQNRDLVLDIISELEDNLRTAQSFQVERAYLRPSYECWKAFRNKVHLPEAVRAKLTNVYAEINRWAGIVDSGVNPLTGSMTIPAIAMEMRSKLPPLIEQLKELGS